MAESSSPSKLPKHHIEHHIISVHEDDYDSTFKVRRHGKLFYIEMSPSFFVNCPATTEKYKSYVELFKSGLEVMDDTYDTDVYERVLTPFETFLKELAPPPPGDFKDIKVTLQKYLSPDFFLFHFGVIDEKPCPRRIRTEQSPFKLSFTRFDDDFLDELETWTTFVNPAEIILSPGIPEDAPFREPRKVLIRDDTIECFFKPVYFQSTDCVRAANLQEDSRRRPR